MNSLRRSFVYAFIIYMVIILLFVWLEMRTQDSQSVTRQKIDPSSLKFKQEQKEAPKPQSKPTPPLKKQPRESTYPKKEALITPTTPPKEPLTKPTPEIEPEIVTKKEIELPKKDALIQSIFDNLPAPQTTAPKDSAQEEMLKELYGETYTQLSEQTKTYLQDNHLIMQAITQKVLNRIGRVYLDPRFYYYDHNFVEFILYPDGSISDIVMLRDSGFKLLDKITKETIETAYKDYPAPKEPTLIRYKFLYDLRGY